MQKEKQRLESLPHNNDDDNLLYFIILCMRVYLLGVFAHNIYIIIRPTWRLTWNSPQCALKNVLSTLLIGINYYYYYQQWVCFRMSYMA